MGALIGVGVDAGMDAELGALCWSAILILIFKVGLDFKIGLAATCQSQYLMMKEVCDRS